MLSGKPPSRRTQAITSGIAIALALAFVVLGLYSRLWDIAVSGAFAAMFFYYFSAREGLLVPSFAARFVHVRVPAVLQFVLTAVMLAIIAVAAALTTGHVAREVTLTAVIGLVAMAIWVAWRLYRAKSRRN